jgi:MFS family permease
VAALLLNEQEHPGPQHYRILLLSWAGWVFDFYDLILYTFLLLPISIELNLDHISLSYVLGASLAATAAGGVLFGILSDRFGRKAVLQWTILTYSLGTFCSGFSSSLEMLLVFRIVTGLGVGGEWGIGQTYVGETFPPHLRGRYGAYMQTGAPIGIALATIVGGFVAPVIGWRAAFFLSVLPALLVVVVRRSLPESDVWLLRKPTGGVQDNPFAAEFHRFMQLFAPAYRRIFLLSLTLAVFDMSAYWFTYSWLPGYLHQERQFSTAKSAW